MALRTYLTYLLQDPLLIHQNQEKSKGATSSQKRPTFRHLTPKRGGSRWTPLQGFHHFSGAHTFCFANQKSPLTTASPASGVAAGRPRVRGGVWCAVLCLPRPCLVQPLRAGCVFFCGHSEKNHPLGGGVGHTFNNDLHRTFPIQWCALRQRQRQFRLGNVLCRKISVLLRLVLVLCWMLVEAPNYPKGAPCKVFIAYPVLCLKKVGVAFPDGRTNA